MHLIIQIQLIATKYFINILVEMLENPFLSLSLYVFCLPLFSSLKLPLLHTHTWAKLLVFEKNKKKSFKRNDGINRSHGWIVLNCTQNHFAYTILSTLNVQMY